MEKTPVSNELFPELWERIKNALRASQEIDNYEQKKGELRQLRQAQVSGLNSEQSERYRSLKQELGRLVVTVQTLGEFKTLLTLLRYPDDRIRELLNHENAHANVAEQLPSQEFAGYEITFFRDKNGKSLYTPSAKTRTNMSFPEKQRLKEERTVVEAPLSAGDKLSSGDEKILEK